MLKTFGLILTTVALIVLLMQGQTNAQSASFQSDINALRSQVSQLQSQVSQLLSRQGSYTPPSSSTPPARRNRSVDLSDAQIIDRLATLAIEAKDRLNALESRVTKLERTR